MQSLAPPKHVLAVAGNARVTVHYVVAVVDPNVTEFKLTPRLDGVPANSLAKTVPAAPYAPVVLQVPNDVPVDVVVVARNSIGQSSAESTPSPPVTPTDPAQIVQATSSEPDPEALTSKWEFWAMAVLLAIIVVLLVVSIVKLAQARNRQKPTRDWIIGTVVASLYAVGVAVPMGIIIQNTINEHERVAVPALGDAAVAPRDPPTCVPTVAFPQSLFQTIAAVDINVNVVGTQHSAPECDTPIAYRWKITPHVSDRASNSGFGPGFRLTEEDSDTLLIPTYTLRPDTLYQLEVRAGHDGNDQTFANTAFATLFISQLPLLADIVGGASRTVLRSRAFVLDARNSADPNLDPFLGEPYNVPAQFTFHQGYTFTWTGVDVANPSQPVVLSDGSEFGTRTGSLVALTRAATLNTPGTYRFTLEFGTGDETQSATTSTLVTVVDQTAATATLLSDNPGLIRSGQIARFSTVISPVFSGYTLQYTLSPRPTWATDDMLRTDSDTPNVEGFNTVSPLELPKFEPPSPDELFLQNLWEPGQTYTLSVEVTGTPPGTLITQPSAASTQFRIATPPVFVGTLAEDPLFPQNSNQKIKFRLEQGGTDFSWGLSTVVTPFRLRRADDPDSEDPIRIGDAVTLHTHNMLDRQVQTQFAVADESVTIGTAAARWTLVSSGGQGLTDGTPITEASIVQLRNNDNPALFIGQGPSDRIIYSAASPSDLRLSGSSSSSSSSDLRYNTDHLRITSHTDNKLWQTRAVSGLTPITFFTDRNDWMTETPPLSFSLFFTLNDDTIQVVVGDDSTVYNAPASITTTFMPAGNPINAFNREWGMLVREASGASVAATRLIRLFPLL